MVKADRAREVLEYAALHGDDEAIEAFDLKPDTLRRYRNEHPMEDVQLSGILKKIQETYTTEELSAIAKGGQLREREKPQLITHTGTEYRFGVMGDTHIGSNTFHPEYLDRAYEVFRDAGITTILHVGDVTEGMSNRPGHIYELTHLGYAQQKEYAVEQLSKWGGEWYMIDGNHDRWFTKSNGAMIVKDICDSVEGAHFLGHDEGDLDVNGVWVKLWHGEDGSSYATSYRLQKLIEAFTGGEKPNILLAGHVHKQGYFFERHIHAVSTGALCTQSKWMRSTRKPNHTGFWTIEFEANEDGVVRFTPTFYPFYA
jgi:predicted phosphodiesterase